MRNLICDNEMYSLIVSKRFRGKIYIESDNSIYFWMGNDGLQSGISLCYNFFTILGVDDF